jgi:hypothetical protein
MRPLVPRSRYFTPAEANALLPLVRAVIKDAAERARLHNEVVDQLNDSAEEEDAELWARRKQEARRLRDEVETLVEQLGEEGVEVKGLSPGLVDFPALHGGVEVFLCWKEGETTITHWHPLHTGIAGREAVVDDGGWAWLN